MLLRMMMLDVRMMLRMMMLDARMMLSDDVGCEDDVEGSENIICDILFKVVINKLCSNFNSLYEILESS
jgi:hypothetical protein